MNGFCRCKEKPETVGDAYGLETPAEYIAQLSNTPMLFNS